MAIILVYFIRSKFQILFICKNYCLHCLERSSTGIMLSNTVLWFSGLAHASVKTSLAWEKSQKKKKCRRGPPPLPSYFSRKAQLRPEIVLPHFIEINPLVQLLRLIRWNKLAYYGWRHEMFQLRGSIKPLSPYQGRWLVRQIARTEALSYAHLRSMQKLLASLIVCSLFAL